VTPVQPQILIHRGVVQAAGFFFDTHLLDEATARQRILTLWIPGARVYRLPEGLLLHLPVPQRVRCELAPGLPFVAVNGLLLASPLTPNELRRLNAPAGALLLTYGGSMRVYDLVNAVSEEPAAWLDMTDWQPLRTTTLGRPPAPPRLVAEPAPFDPRARLAGVPAEAPERALLLEALQRAMQAEGAKGAGRGPGAGEPRSVGERVGSWLQRLVAGKGHGEERRGLADQSLSKQGWSMGDLIHRFATRLLVTSGLARVVGRRQAEYIGRMMEMFERGDLHEALRHAIPMGAMEGKPSLPALGVPTPRRDLTLTSQRTLARAAFHLDTELYAQMIALYRQAFRKLEAEGRIEEAAFVLAELLGANEEAVSFLEKHQRFRLAAEMAEARNLPPGLVVRQWFLAGETQRAILAARRTGAFADAVLRLERTDAEKARELRLYWAIALAAAGDFPGAVEVLQPVMDQAGPLPEIQQRIAAWTEEALALGGQVAARMLAKKVVLFPEEAKEIQEQALALLEEESEETHRDRRVFAFALCEGAATPLSRFLARAAARSLLRDAGNSTLEPNDWQRLIRFTGDAVLRADLPSLPLRVSAASERDPPLILRISAADRGILPLYDAALLPGGRCIVALGEAGMRLITREGRTVVHVEQPAHRLVVSDHGSQVIALAPRGDVWRMARMNLATRKAETWQEACLRAFAPDYDGSLWFVAVEKDFLALDATADGLDALWRLPNLEGVVQSIARSAAQCSFLLFNVSETDSWGRPTGLWTRLERWTHALPSLFLRDRNEIPSPPETAKEGIDYVRAITPEGDVFSLYIEPADAGLSGNWNVVLIQAVQGSSQVATRFQLSVAGEPPFPLPPVVSSRWIVLAIRQAGGVDCRVLNRKTLTERAQITLAGSGQVSIRLSDACLILTDDQGRLLVLDLDQRRLLRDLRMR
jgi:hypothetical protein